MNDDEIILAVMNVEEQNESETESDNDQEQKFLTRKMC